MDQYCLKLIIEQLSNSRLFKDDYNAFLRKLENTSCLRDRLALLCEDGAALDIQSVSLVAILEDSKTWNEVVVETFKLTMGPPDKTEDIANVPTDFPSR